MKPFSPLSKNIFSKNTNDSIIVIDQLSQQDNISNTATEGDEMGKISSSNYPVKTQFIREFFSHLGISTLFILTGLLVGLIGYHWTNHLSWVDALVEASMILSGMGPIFSLSTTSAKVFASVYALFSGLIFVLAMGVVLSPLVSSLLKQLSYLSLSDQQKKSNNKDS